MTVKKKPIPARGSIILFLVLLNAISIRAGYSENEKWYWVLIITLPLLLLAILKYWRQLTS